MKSTLRTISMLFFTALIMAAAGHPVTAADADAPQIEISEPDYAFPPIAEGQTVQHDFIVRNNGTGTLEIAEVKTD